ncbi:hypothetical protein M231_00204 [Tremella mesenterica]|uniref:Uncharacterized protein n=1 Tax=Tremella mesenterica TaxID=5217 RepID=A0A4Q1BWW4_TREME|nr:hypothetical protein M231_00204 [Tremella mesenterica]
MPRPSTFGPLLMYHHTHITHSVPPLMRIKDEAYSSSRLFAAAGGPPNATSTATCPQIAPRTFPMVPTSVHGVTSRRAGGRILESTHRGNSPAQISPPSALEHRDLPDVPMERTRASRGHRREPLIEPPRPTARTENLIDHDHPPPKLPYPVSGSKLALADPSVPHVAVSTERTWSNENPSRPVAPTKTRNQILPEVPMERFCASRGRRREPLCTSPGPSQPSESPSCKNNSSQSNRSFSVVNAEEISGRIGCPTAEKLKSVPMERTVARSCFHASLPPSNNFLFGDRNRFERNPARASPDPLTTYRPIPGPLHGRHFVPGVYPQISACSGPLWAFTEERRYRQPAEPVERDRHRLEVWLVGVEEARTQSVAVKEWTGRRGWDAVSGLESKRGQRKSDRKDK